MIKAFNYFGSKNSPAIARWIISNLPEHDRYLEPFGGSAAILLNKPRCQEEIYSDIYHPASFFLACLNLNPARLIGEIEWLLENVNEPRLFVRNVPEVRERSFVEAAKFYLYCHYSWSGGGTNWSSGFSSDAEHLVARSVRPKLQHLIEASDRLKDVEIWQKDAFELIRAFPSDERSLIYVDPPYLPTSRKSKDDRVSDKENSSSRRRYAHELTIEQHIELASLLQNRSAIVSGYDSHLYSELYRGWEKRSMKHAGDTEIIWISPIAQMMTSQLSFDLTIA